MDEYIITIIDSIKSYAETVEELIDNMVCMEHIKSIASVIRIKDNKTWNIKDDVSLSLLREYRKRITDHVGLRNILTGKEELDEKS